MSKLWPLPDDPLVGEVEQAVADLRLEERYAALDRAPRFPTEEFRGLGSRRLLGLTVPTAAGGRGLPPVRAAVLLFRLAYRSGTTFAKLSLQPEFCSVLREIGSDEQREAWFRPLLRGERLVGNQITEPGAGSDARSLSLTARRDGTSYRLTGTKSEAAFACDADAALVYAKVEGSDPPGRITAFLVPQDLAGISRETYSPDMGERWQRRGAVRYDDVRVAAASRVGAEGEGFAPLLGELARERGLLAAIYLGVARASLDEAVEHVGRRVAFGRPLSDNQAVSFPIVEALAQLEAAWLLARDALARLDVGEGAAPLTALAKVLATRAALDAIDRALQAFGGAGYSSRHRHEQRYRDVRSGAIAHGTSEVLTQTAARTLWPPRRS